MLMHTCAGTIQGVNIHFRSEPHRFPEAADAAGAEYCVAAADCHVGTAAAGAAARTTGVHETNEWTGDDGDPETGRGWRAGDGVTASGDPE